MAMLSPSNLTNDVLNMLRKRDKGFYSFVSFASQIFLVVI